MLTIHRKDPSRQSLVLYNQASRELALINDPGEYQQYEAWNASSDASSLIPLSNQHGGGGYCPECGHYTAAPHNNVNNANAETPTPAGTSTQRPPLRQGELIRDANYFKLLDVFDGVPIEEPFSGEPSRSSSRETPKTSSRSSSRAGTPVGIYSSISESAFSQGYFDRFFKVISTLGKGSRGVVYLVEHVLDGYSLGMFALKKVAVGNDHKWLEKVLSEVHLLRLLSHPNLVNYNHMWLESSALSRFAPEVPCAFILQEYCNGGTLEDYVRRLQNEAITDSARTRKEQLREKRRKSQLNHDISRHEVLHSALLTPTEIMLFFRDIVRGVQHLHSHQVIHRDLKPSNCLLITSNPEDDKSNSSGNGSGKFPTVLVSDFGEGQMEGILRSGTGTTGTLEYCAPELLKPSPSLLTSRLSQFSKRTDVFSLGMIFHFLCFSRLPYSPHAVDGGGAEDVEQLRTEVLGFKGFDYSNIPVRDDLPKDAYMLLAKMLSVNPLERPLTEEILEALELLIGEMNISNTLPGASANNTVNNGTQSSERVDAPMRNPRASIRLISNQSIEDAKSLDLIPLIQQDRLHELPKSSPLHQHKFSLLQQPTSYLSFALKTLLIALQVQSVLYPSALCFSSTCPPLNPHVSNLLCVIIGLELTTPLTRTCILFGLHFAILISSFSSSDFTLKTFIKK